MPGDTIYLVRHGQTEWNAAGRLQGHLDSPLTERGVAHAEGVGRALRLMLGEALAANRPATAPSIAIESSDLGRARQTAAIIACGLGTDPATIWPEPLLREHDLGAWSGLTHAERDVRFPGEAEARELDRWNYVIAGGESYATALPRAESWLERPRHAPITIAVTHEMMSRTIQGAYLHLAPSAILEIDHDHEEIVRLRDGSITRVSAAG